MNTWAAAILFGLGLLLGSFANVCIWRLPREESIVFPPSHCPACGKNLKPWHLVPILSWLALRGRCGMCGESISWRYPLVELLTAIILGGLGWVFGFSLTTLALSLLAMALIVAIGTDLSHRMIPDQVSLGTAAVLAVLALLTLNWSALVGGALLFSILLLIAIASGGGMGGGDIKLSLVIGLALGWRLGLVALMLSFFVGGLVSIGLLLAKKAGKKSELPFGPYLALGAGIAMFWGDMIISAYWNFSLMLWRW